jgi:hypothetical protein
MLVGEQSFRVCNPKLVQIVVERDTHNVVEEATEMVPAHVRCPSDIGEGNRLR